MNDAVTPAPLPVALVGAGGFARFVTAAGRGLVDVRTVHDADAARAAALAGELGAVACPDVASAMAVHGVEAVVVATPPATHAGLSIAALEAGLAVFCEKPAALTVAEAGALDHAVRTTGLTYVVDHVIHYNPLVSLLRRLMDRGVLAPVVRFTFDNDAGDSDLGPEHWFWDPAASGGILLEHAVHFLDVARLLTGSPERRVQAMAHRRTDGRTDAVVATVEHADGTLSTHSHGFHHDNRTERQHMRLDHTTAESRLEGWIPLSLEVDGWVDDAGLAVLEEVAADPRAWLDVPGYVATTRETATLRVEREAAPEGLRTGDAVHALPHHASLMVQLGEPADKQEVYAASVRAALTDLVACVRSGSAPSAGVDQAVSAVLAAEAGTRAAVSGRIEQVASVAAQERGGATD